MIVFSYRYNRDKWILYFFDDATRMNFIYTLFIKFFLLDSV
jgi:hypothetical protein